MDRERALATELAEAVASGVKTIDRVAAVSKTLSLEGAGALFGTLGGFCGMAAAYAVALVVSTVSLPIALPLGLGIGMAGSLLIYRGTSSFKYDRAIEHQRRQANHLLEQVKLLPKQAPAAVREHLWLEYQKSVTHISDKSLLALPVPKDLLRLSPPRGEG